MMRYIKNVYLQNKKDFVFPRQKMLGEPPIVELLNEHKFHS
jgi:hypothetical protein